MSVYDVKPRKLLLVGVLGHVFDVDSGTHYAVHEE